MFAGVRPSCRRRSGGPGRPERSSPRRRRRTWRGCSGRRRAAPPASGAAGTRSEVVRAHVMLRDRILTQSELIRAILLEYSPCCGVLHLPGLGDELHQVQQPELLRRPLHVCRDVVPEVLAPGLQTKGTLFLDPPKACLSRRFCCCLPTLVRVDAVQPRPGQSSPSAALLSHAGRRFNRLALVFRAAFCSMCIRASMSFSFCVPTQRHRTVSVIDTHRWILSEVITAIVSDHSPCLRAPPHRPSRRFCGGKGKIGWEQGWLRAGWMFSRPAPNQ